MPAPLPKITQWSFSRYKDYMKCAFLAYFKHIRKIKEPPGKAMARGQYVDDLCTKYATKQIATCPPELQLFKTAFMDLRKRAKTLHMQAELAFTADWKPRAWFDHDVGLIRIKMDCFYDDKNIRKIIDFKTGQIYPDNIDQLDLYAVAGFVTAPPEIDRIEADLWYLDQGDPVGRIGKAYTRAEAEALKKVWAKRTKPMLNDQKYKPTPGNHCRWCFFGQSGKVKGGPGLCKH